MESVNGNGHELMTRNALTAFEPNSIEEAFRLAGILVQSGLLPKAITKPEAALAIIMAGRELGLNAMQSLRSIYIIEGKPILSADLQLALCKRSPLCKLFRLVESSGKVATYETERVNEGKTTMSFTFEQAHAAGVTTKDNWKRYPDAMLRARCIAALARAVYPDLLMGVYDPDEIAVEPSQPPARYVDVEVSPSPPPAPHEESADEAIERWTALIQAAPNMAGLKSVGAALSKGNPPMAVRDALQVVYVARQKELLQHPKKPAATPPVATEVD